MLDHAWCAARCRITDAVWYRHNDGDDAIGAYGWALGWITGQPYVYEGDHCLIVA